MPAKNIYVKIGGNSKKITNIYTVVNGAKKKITKGYVVVNGAKKQFYPEDAPQPTFTFKYLKAAGPSNIQYDGPQALNSPVAVTVDNVSSGNTVYKNRNAYLYGDLDDTIAKKVYKITYSGAIIEINTSYAYTNSYAGAYAYDVQDNSGLVIFGNASGNLFGINPSTDSVSNLGSIFAFDCAASSRIYKTTYQGNIYYDEVAYFFSLNDTAVRKVDGRGSISVVSSLSTSTTNRKALGFNFQTTSNLDHYGILITGGDNTSAVEAYNISGTKISSIAQLPYNTSDHALANLGCYILVAGGYQGNSISSSVYAYDGRYYTRSTQTSLWKARAGLKGGSIGNDWNGHIGNDYTSFPNNAIFGGGYISGGTATNAVDRYVLRANGSGSNDFYISKVSIGDFATARKNHVAFNVTSNDTTPIDKLVFAFGSVGDGGGEAYTSAANSTYFVTETINT